MEGGENQQESSALAEVPIEDPKPFNQAELLKALEVVERDSLAIAQSYTSLFGSLRLALSEVTSTSIDHIQCFNDAAGKLQEAAIDATTRGNRFIHSCIRLNGEMKGVDALAAELKGLEEKCRCFRFSCQPASQNHNMMQWLDPFLRRVILVTERSSQLGNRHS